MAFTETGNFVARGADKVDPQLVEILREAAAKSGMSVEAYSGFRPGDPRFHGHGKATDVRIMGADGKPIPNYQSPENFSTYEKLAKDARQIQMEKYPQLADQFRWGGYFGGPKGKYGAMDLMHFDLGGGPNLGMAGGSWDKGLSQEQAALFGMNQPQQNISSQIAARPNSPPLPPGAPAPPLESYNVQDHPIGAMAPTPSAPTMDAITPPAPQQSPWDIMGQMAAMAPQQPQFQPVEIRGPSPEQAQALTSFLEALKKEGRLMAANIYDWSSTAANNASADTGLTWAEGQAPDTVNDSARMMMKRVKDFIVDIGGSLSAAGTANALTLTVNSAFSAYATGQLVAFTATAINTTAATLNVNGIGAKSIRKMTSATGESALIGNEIQIGGIYLAQYSAALNSAAGGWLLVNPTNLAEVTLTTVQTLTNKTLTTPTINGGVIAQPTLTLLQGTTPTAEGDIRWDATNNRLAIGDSAATQTISPNPATTVDNTVPRHDGTKGFTQTSGVTISDTDVVSAVGFQKSGTNLPFQSGFESTQQTYTLAGSLTLAHGLGAQPKLYLVVLQCVTTQFAYAPGDEILINPGTNQSGSGDHGLSVFPDATNINIRFGAEVICIFHKTTGAIQTGLTPANWKLVVRAWA